MGQRGSKRNIKKVTGAKGVFNGDDSIRPGSGAAKDQNKEDGNQNNAEYEEEINSKDADDTSVGSSSVTSVDKDFRQNNKDDDEDDNSSRRFPEDSLSSTFSLESSKLYMSLSLSHEQQDEEQQEQERQQQQYQQQKWQQETQKRRQQQQQQQRRRQQPQELQRQIQQLQQLQQQLQQQQPQQPQQQQPQQQQQQQQQPPQQQKQQQQPRQQPQQNPKPIFKKPKNQSLDEQQQHLLYMQHWLRMNTQHNPSDSMSDESYNKKKKKKKKSQKAVVIKDRPTMELEMPPQNVPSVRLSAPAVLPSDPTSPTPASPDQPIRQPNQTTQPDNPDNPDDPARQLTMDNPLSAAEPKKTEPSNDANLDNPDDPARQPASSTPAKAARRIRRPRRPGRTTQPDNPDNPDDPDNPDNPARHLTPNGPATQPSSNSLNPPPFIKNAVFGAVPALPTEDEQSKPLVFNKDALAQIQVNRYSWIYPNQMRCLPSYKLAGYVHQ